MKLVYKKVIMNDKEVEKTLKRLVHEIIEKTNGIENLVFVGLQTRGVYLSKRIVAELKKITKKTVPLGILDITLYRDDISSISRQPVVKETKIPFDVTGKDVILIDDVLYTGRTVRAAIDEIIDFGRPRTIKLAVLIDRGGRELPIQPDFIGKYFPISKEELICVNLKEIDNEDNIVLKEKR
ncbi:MAG: bifunctional pyr operon transcriptional regulator/uracil phosphoribosyltransferase PyrR [Elusimicrobia bacterium]|jgi:pyrimidine operon attenuation protein/uracil phosphoribosyltransferase|nr:bifunctional pyr operon transcriptional regulator/uracil phosphoribosyltransferase PyrR [Elusimicrobiota bacterium]